MPLVKRSHTQPTNLGTDAAPESGVVDGRTLRSVRSRNAIVDAVVALVAEERVDLTVEVIAARAGVGARTVFRQFEGTGAIFELLQERIASKALEVAFDWAPTGSLLGDIDALVLARSRVFVMVEPLRHLGRTWRLSPPKEPHGKIATIRRRFRARLRSVLATHVKRFTRDDLEALDAWLSIDVWDRLHERQGLSHARTVRVMQRTARTLARALARRARRSSSTPSTSGAS